MSQEEDMLRFAQPHPYDQKGVNRDEWIDRFRQVFFSNPEAGRKVLVFLGNHWHFFRRRTVSVEWQVQRQCYIDLLICLGVWQTDTEDQIMQAILEDHDEEPSRTKRLVLWLRRLGGIRTNRVEKHNVGDKKHETT